ncbi:ABC transporter family protein [Labedaea rhizosphaerae]|uniref:ABC transporter family protein n=1 Tax=Labedaea rhizosphaerae TaxID=598644 RepID=A0A4V3CZP0_LABRH|nr:ABC transporter family protein [Labedaea rhizosphaerae]
MTVPPSPAGPGGWWTELDGSVLDLPPGTITVVVAGPHDDPAALAESLGDRCREDGQPRATSSSRRQVRLVGAGAGLVAHRTVFGNALAPLRRFGADAGWCASTAMRLLDLVGLAGKAGSLTHQLSGGERWRAALAVALAHGPDVLVAGDPLAGHDECDAAGVLAALDRIRAELGTTVLVVAADARQAGRVADRVAVRGRDGAAPVCEPVFAALMNPSSPVAEVLLPAIADAAPAPAQCRLVDAVLIGHAALAAVATSSDLVVLDAERIRLGETPVARYRLAVREGAVAALELLDRIAAQMCVVDTATSVALAA